MALQALAPYYLKTADKIDEVDQAVLDRVKSAVDKGLTLISSIQEGDGGFSSMGGRSSESCCQIIVALSSLRIDLKTDKRFIKEGHTVLDALLSYYDGNGGFYHTDGEDEDVYKRQAQLNPNDSKASVQKTDTPEQGESLESTNAPNQKDGKDDEKDVTIFKIIADVVKANPVVTIVILAGVAGVIGLGALRRRRIQ